LAERVHVEVRRRAHIDTFCAKKKGVPLQRVQPTTSARARREAKVKRTRVVVPFGLADACCGVERERRSVERVGQLEWWIERGPRKHVVDIELSQVSRCKPLARHQDGGEACASVARGITNRANSHACMAEHDLSSDPDSALRAVTWRAR
jgi:hypothetical protein